jgi:hypothetical protein
MAHCFLVRGALGITVLPRVLEERLCKATGAFLELKEAPSAAKRLQIRKCGGVVQISLASHDVSY